MKSLHLNRIALRSLEYFTEALKENSPYPMEVNRGQSISLLSALVSTEAR